MQSSHFRWRSASLLMFLTSIGGSLVWGMHTPEFASAKMEGDPIIHGFRHDEFEFFGTPGQFYNLVSDGNTYQITTKLKEGQELDGAVYHNGTYMEAIGVHYKECHILVEVLDDGNMAMNMDSRKVEMEQDKVEFAKKVILKDDSIVDVKWHYYVPDVGNAIQITTGLMGSADLMRATINAITPGDIKDPPEGISPVQPSYLNIEVALLSAPEWPLQGIIGETFDHPNDPEKEAKLKPHRHPLHPDDHYKVKDLFIQIGDYVPSAQKTA